jgi:hypothetical protein
VKSAELINMQTKSADKKLQKAFSVAIHQRRQYNLASARSFPSVILRVLSLSRKKTGRKAFIT